jgi:hypothetical protein
MTRYTTSLFLMFMLASSTAFAVGEECTSDDDCPFGEVCWFLDGDTGLCDADSCSADSDCGDCATCVDGACEALGEALCASSADCDEGDYCAKDFLNPCSTSCETIPEDACTNDADCEGEETCVMLPDGSGLGSCILDGDPCVENDDCEGCQLCSDGFCAGSIDLACQSSFECEIGEYCALDLADACASVCLPLEDGMCYSDSECADEEVCAYLDNGWDVGYCEEDIVTVCAADEDCGACAVCVDGECKATGAVMCESNGDCGDDEFCHTDLDDPCMNACEELPEDGCTKDSDCPEEYNCEMLPDGSGLGGCVEVGPDPECETDDECGACSVCVGGECKGTGAIVCEADADCADGESCIVDAEDACMNQCKPEDPVLGCTTDDDCGACAACVDGECKGTGAVMCEADADCSDGKVCTIDADNACMNECTAKAPECATDDDCTAPATCVSGICQQPTDGSNGGGGGDEADDAICAMTGFDKTAGDAPLALVLALVSIVALAHRRRRASSER